MLGNCISVEKSVKSRSDRLSLELRLPAAMSSHQTTLALFCTRSLARGAAEVLGGGRACGRVKSVCVMRQGGGAAAQDAGAGVHPSATQLFELLGAWLKVFRFVQL